MKLIIVFGFLFNIFSQVSGQDNPIINRDNQVVRFANGIIFLPQDSITDRLERLYKNDVCSSYTTFYFLDGLKLSEQIFEREKLYEVVIREGRYTIQFKDSDPTKCVEILNFFLSINVPVFVNDIELEPSEAQKVLADIKPEQIISIKKRKTWLFGSTYFEILTQLE